jgi:XRN-Two Binding Domain, XTBD
MEPVNASVMIETAFFVEESVDPTNVHQQPGKSINQRKASHETETQWQYRKKFLLHYDGQYPIEQLECWSKILSNSKFYGCV